MAQEAPLYQNLTVGETLRVIASLNRRWDADRARERLDDLGIPLSRRVRRMSGGQQAQLALTQWWTQPGGTPASQSEIATLTSQLRQAGGLPTPLAVQQWFAEQGYLKYYTYQPAGRFRHFQYIEGSWLLALSILLAAATIWLIRHRAT